MITEKYKVDPRTYIPLDSIAYIQSVCPSTVLHLKDGKQLASCRPIGYVQGQLPHLIRVHRAFAVRIDEVQAAVRIMTKSGAKAWQLRLKSGEVIPVGRNHGQAIQSILLSEFL